MSFSPLCTYVCLPAPHTAALPCAVLALPCAAPHQMTFHNITRIMDCVGCEKCKMWAKLQLLGIATSLKILFSAEDCGGNASDIAGGWVGGWVEGWVGGGGGSGEARALAECDTKATGMRQLWQGSRPAASCSSECGSRRRCIARGQGRAGQGRAGQGRAGQGRAGQGRAGLTHCIAAAAQQELQGPAAHALHKHKRAARLQHAVHLQAVAGHAWVGGWVHGGHTHGAAAEEGGQWAAARAHAHALQARAPR